MSQPSRRFNFRFSGKQLLGSICCDCGSCFVSGGSPYAVAAYLPDGWAFDGITLLHCRSCGTQHAIEHASPNDRLGRLDRLRVFRPPVQPQTVPAVGLRARDATEAIRTLRRGWLTRESEFDHRFVLSSEIRLNLLPMPRRPWTAHRVAEQVRYLLKLIPFGIFHIPPMLARLLFYRAVDALGKRLRKPPVDLPRIRVESPETLPLRIQQLLDNHRRFEAQWPVVTELSVDDGIVPTPTDELVCANCQCVGTLRLFPEVEKPAQPRGPWQPIRRGS